MSFEYECALSGLTAESGHDDDSDGLGDLPIGWTRVQFTRRAMNPEWLQLQQLKDMLMAQSLAQVPPEHQDVQRPLLGLQIRAQFSGIESDIPVYLPDVDEVVFLSGDGDIAEDLNELREMLGLEPVPAPVPFTLAGVDEGDDEFEFDDDDEELTSEPETIAPEPEQVQEQPAPEQAAEAKRLEKNRKAREVRAAKKAEGEGAGAQA